MKANREKFELAMARKCMNANDVAVKAKMPQQSVKNSLYGRNVRPMTLGKIAQALGVDVTDIMEG